MNGIPSYQCPDGVYTTWDRWQDAEKRVAELEHQAERLKNALRIMGINPESLLDNKSGN